MSDWRFSYFTMSKFFILNYSVPSYEAMVLERFGNLFRKKLIYRGSRAVFWSVEHQRIMDENSLEQFYEIIDCAIAKFPIRTFGKKSEKIKSFFPDAKLLVFCSEPWKILGSHV